MPEKILLNEQEINQLVINFSNEIYKDIKDINKLVIIGIQTRGIELAKRLKEQIESLAKLEIPLGTLDISLFRDDLATRGALPAIKETDINFDISNLTVLLVDDVIFTGRTTKAALETLMTFGRPKKILLFSLIDRGNRELPLQPDYCGLKIKTKVADKIKVLLSEIDKVQDKVIFINSKDISKGE